MNASSLEHLSLAVEIISNHIPTMGYRHQIGDESTPANGTLVDGQNSGAVDMLSPETRTLFDDMLGDLCHFVSMQYRNMQDQEPTEEEV